MENIVSLDHHPATGWHHYLASVIHSLLTGLLLAISVLDDTGQTVALTTPAQRIVSLSPAITELVFAAGAGDRLIAIDSYSDYPPDALNLPKIGTTGGLDREKLLQLQPDLVIAWASGNKATDLRWLQQTGIPVYHSEPKQLDDIALNIIDIGIMAGTQTIANTAAQAFRLSLIEGCSGARTDAPLSVYYEVWSRPAMTIGGQHWLNEALNLAGLANVYTDQPRAVFSIEAESALARPYQVKIIDPYLWTKTATSEDHRLIQGNLLLDRPGPRISAGIKQLCKQLD